jgi:hypothetical protein
MNKVNRRLPSKRLVEKPLIQSFSAKVWPSACLGGWRSINFTNDDKHLGKPAENWRALAGFGGWLEAYRELEST